MRCTILFFLLLVLPGIIGAAQVVPLGAKKSEVKRSLFSCICCATREARERQKQLEETEQTFKHAEEQAAQERRRTERKTLATAKSDDLHRATGQGSIGNLKALQRQIITEQAVEAVASATLSIAITARTVSPFAPVSPLGIGSISSKEI